MNTLTIDSHNHAHMAVALLCFYEDMGDRPEGMTIERKDVNGHYTPENCIWIPRPLQDRNKRTNVWLEVDGVRVVQVAAEEVLCMAEKSLSKVVRKHRRRGNEVFKCKGRAITILPVTDQEIPEFQ